ncbi:MAG: superoxide dismutase [Fe] [Gammaproteobacteria bacterium]|jgi:Fe-Mn family superoxide dismutase|nr:superoxide dismutase [Fe] [Gammaproteobacteria bacterium]
MSIEFPDLPYATDALEPHLSAKTLEFHHGKHHKSYVDKLNSAIQGTAYEDQSLETIMTGAHEASETAVFNNAAQAWNHSFLWHSMSPDGGGKPTGALADAINARFGNLEKFQAEFKAAALGRFGSGWAWLVRTADGLDIVSTGNADTPLIDGATPLLTLDVWEHAYYLDYQNKRRAYIDAYLSELINWDFAAQNYEAKRAVA